MAFPEIQNDGTVEVSNADTINFGEGLTATNPSGDTAKIVGPKNTNQSTSYDEVTYSAGSNASVNVTTTSITDDSGESGSTRLNVEFSATDTDTQDPIDLFVDGGNIDYNVEGLNLKSGNSMNLTGTSAGSSASGDTEVLFDVDESAINHNNLTNSAQDDAHHGAGSGLNFSGGNMNIDDPLSIGTINATNNISTDVIQDNGSGGVAFQFDNGNTGINVKAGSWQTEDGSIFSDSSPMSILDSSGADNITTQSNVFDANTRVETPEVRPASGAIVNFFDAGGASRDGQGAAENTVIAFGEFTVGDGSVTTGYTVNVSTITNDGSDTSGPYTVDLSVTGESLVPVATGENTAAGTQIVDTNTIKVAPISTPSSGDVIKFIVCGW